MSKLIVRAVGLGLLLAAAPAGAQSLNDIPLAKKLTLANVGDEEAQIAVAEAYEQGSGGAKVNVTEAARYYHLAAVQGNVEAQYRLARIVAAGAGGLKQDYGTAAKLYRDAAAKGHALAMDALGRLYQNGMGVAADPGKAAEW